METNTPTGPLAASPPGGSPTPPAPSLGAGNGLPSVDSILAKRAAGTKLTKSEAARLSWVNRPKRPVAQSAYAAPPAGGSPVDGGVASPGPGALPPPPPVDEALCRDTAAEILDTLNAAAADSITSQAKAAGADAETTKQFVERAALTPAKKTTLVNTAPRWLPKLVRIAGLNPENAPEALAGLTAALWGVGYISASSSLKRLAKERQSPPPAASQEKPKTE